MCETKDVKRKNNEENEARQKHGEKKHTKRKKKMMGVLVR